MCVCVRTCVYVCACVRMCAYVCIYIYVCIVMRVCMCVCVSTQDPVAARRGHQPAHHALDIPDALRTETALVAASDPQHPLGRRAGPLDLVSSLAIASG